MHEIRIARATAADATAIRDLTRAAYAKWVPVIGREPKPMMADYDHAVQNHIIDLLFEGDKMVALVETIVNDDHLMIENLAVSPSHQGKGYGKRLLALAETLAASMDFAQIRLYTNKRFDENVALYARCGYDIDHEESFRGGVVVHMSKQISSHPIATS